MIIIIQICVVHAALNSWILQDSEALMASDLALSDWALRSEYRHRRIGWRCRSPGVFQTLTGCFRRVTDVDIVIGRVNSTHESCTSMRWRDPVTHGLVRVGLTCVASGVVWFFKKNLRVIQIYPKKKIDGRSGDQGMQCFIPLTCSQGPYTLYNRLIVVIVKCRHSVSFVAVTTQRLAQFYLSCL